MGKCLNLWWQNVDKFSRCQYGTNSGLSTGRLKILERDFANFLPPQVGILLCCLRCWRTLGPPVWVELPDPFLESFLLVLLSTALGCGQNSLLLCSALVQLGLNAKD